MTTSKKTRASLWTSVLSLVVCLSMLVGTTFAWFTDTASTGVNTIQAGNLDVVLEVYNTTTKQWENAEDQTLKFVKAEGGENQDILWEPGCTYKLPQIKVVNNGDLKLKYKILINGVSGDAGLAKVIEWKLGDNKLDTTKEYSLEPKADSDPITISGHMDENAGNEYKNQSIDGVSITVVATQETGEFDSLSSDYDKTAGYSGYSTANYATAPVEKVVNADGTTTIKDVTLSTSDDKLKVTVPSAAIDPNAEKLELSIVETTAPASISVTDGRKTQAYNITVTGLVANNTTSITADLKTDTGLVNVELYHNDKVVEGATYDKTSGIVSFKTTSFSPFTVVYGEPTKASSSTELTDAVAKGGDVVLAQSANYSVTGANDSTPAISVAKNTTANLDLGSNTITIQTASGENGIVIDEGATATISDGAITQDKTGGSGYPVVKAFHSKLTLNNVDVTLTAEKGVAVSAGSDGGNITINGGTIKGPAPAAGSLSTAAAGACALHVTSKGTITINGDDTVVVGAVYVGSNGIMNITGGDFTQASFYFGSSDKINVSGGTFATPSSQDFRFKIADGYKMQRSDDGSTWTVVKK